MCNTLRGGEKTCSRHVYMYACILNMGMHEYTYTDSRAYKDNGYQIAFANGCNHDAVL